MQSTVRATLRVVNPAGLHARPCHAVVTLALRHLVKDRGIAVIEIIPPALNTDLGGKGLHDHAPPVSDFLDAIFPQLEEGRDELTFGFSEQMRNAGPEQLQAAFARMNP